MRLALPDKKLVETPVSAASRQNAGALVDESKGRGLRTQGY